MKRALLVFAVVHLLAVGAASAEERQDISNWTAPPYWTPPAVLEADRDTNALEELAPSALPSGPMPFVAITPCRLADTRGNGFSGSYGPPALVAGSPRSFPITGQCGIPSGAGAVSFNVTVTGTLGGGMILAYPTGSSAPTVSTLNYVFGQTVANAAVVPLSTGGAATFLAGGHGTQVLLDVNGYYAPVNLVNTLNSLTGNITLAQGTNVTIAPAGNTLTFSSVPGVHTHAASDIVSGTLASARLGGTYSSALTLSNTSNVLMATTLNLNPGTGSVWRGSQTYLHSPNASDFFAGLGAGNVTTSGGSNTGAGYLALNQVSNGTTNAAFGMEALYSNGSGSGNAAFGALAMSNGASSSNNSAFGKQALQTNSGSGNTAVGYQALMSSTGSSNIAIGAGAGTQLTTGDQNIYIGSVGRTNPYPDNYTIRIGDDCCQTQTFIAGIYGRYVGAVNAAVYVDDLGRLGTTLMVSSRRYKTDIEDVGDASGVLLKLRPVSFRYKPDRDPSGEQQYGLIAEEVAEVAPDLVVYNKDGQPETVKYHLVNALLLDQVQRQQARIEKLEAALRALEERLGVSHE